MKTPQIFPRIDPKKLCKRLIKLQDQLNALTSTVNRLLGGGNNNSPGKIPIPNREPAAGAYVAAHRKECTVQKQSRRIGLKGLVLKSVP